MNPEKLDLKFLLTIAIFIGGIGGFYYNTSYQLERMEQRIEQLEEDNKTIIRLEERVKSIQNQTNEIYEILRDIGRSSVESR